MENFELMAPMLILPLRKDAILSHAVQNASKGESQDVAAPHALLVALFALDRLLDERNQFVERVAEGRKYMCTCM